MAFLGSDILPTRVVSSLSRMVTGEVLLLLLLLLPFEEEGAVLVEGVGADDEEEEEGGGDEGEEKEVSSRVRAMYLSCQAGKLDAKYMVSFFGSFGSKVVVLPFWAFLWKEASVEVMDEAVTRM